MSAIGRTKSSLYLSVSRDDEVIAILMIIPKDQLGCWSGSDTSGEVSDLVFELMGIVRVRLLGAGKLFGLVRY